MGTRTNYQKLLCGNMFRRTRFRRLEVSPGLDAEIRTRRGFLEPLDKKKPLDFLSRGAWFQKEKTAGRAQQAPTTPACPRRQLNYEE